MISTYNTFIDADMCRALIKKADQLFPTLNTYEKNSCKNFKEYLDSQRQSGHFIDSSRGNRTQIFFDRSDPLVLPIREKIAELTGLPIEHQTRPLLSVYSEGGSYAYHYDYMDIPPPIEQGGQRLKSFILYLNDDYEGGLTYFKEPKLFVIPKIGKMITFDTVKPEFWKFIGPERFYRNGRNSESYHKVIPVRKGKKYTLILWIREGVPSI